MTGGDGAVRGPLVSLGCDNVQPVQRSCNFTLICWWRPFSAIRNKLPMIAGKALVHRQRKSVCRRCKMGTSCERAVSSAVSYLHVLPSVRLTRCWCSPNHSSCWWHRAPTNTIIIILNSPRWQHGAVNLSLGSRSNVWRSKNDEVSGQCVWSSTGGGSYTVSSLNKHWLSGKRWVWRGFLL